MDQKPTVGRVVHFHYSRFIESDRAYAATVTHVHEDGRVDLFVMAPKAHFHLERVAHEADPARPTAADFWRWPPRA